MKNRFYLIKPSTRAMLREGRKTKDYSWFDQLHGYVYMRWPYLYISMGKGDHPLAKRLAPVVNWLARMVEVRSGPVEAGAQRPTMADGYHGKVVPLAAARELVNIQENVNLENLEHIIPFDRARDIILQNPDHIVVIDCPCRKGMENPCLPMDVCLIVGEPFANFTLEHHPESSRRITPQEAEQILQEEDERGHVHHAFFKDAVMGRFYAICNCCSCCCGAMKAHRNGIPMLISSGYVCEVDEEACAGCGECEEACQFEAITVNGSAEIDPEKCMGCGVCVNLCTQNALFLSRDESRPEPLEIQKLLDSAVQTY